MRNLSVIRLSEPTATGAVRFLSGLHVNLDGDGGDVTRWVTITRTGTFHDKRYGDFDITLQMLSTMVENFRANVYGQVIFIDLNHEIEHGAAAEIKELRVEGNRLRALCEFSDLGVDAVRKRKMKYLSAEFHPNYKDNEHQKEHGPTLLGAALTIRPVIKGLDPVELASPSGESTPVYVHPSLIIQLAEEAREVMNEYVKKLLAECKALKLSEEQTNVLVNALTASIKDSSDSAFSARMLATFEESAVKLAEAGSNEPVTLNITSGLSADDVAAEVERKLAEREQAAMKLAETRDAKVKLFTDSLVASDAFKDDADATKKLADEFDAIITASMSDEQVKALAEREIKRAGELSVSRQLAGLGYQHPRGSLHVQIDTSGDALKLQSMIDGRIGLSDKRKSKKLPHFGEVLLAEFDARNAQRLQSERIMLAGGNTAIADAALPAGFQRTVIMELLSDTNIFNIVNAFTDFAASETVNIPYELRDVTAVYNDGVVFEGQEIPGGSISQLNDLAYVNPMKISLGMTNEVAWFSRNNGLINWDAYARNVSSNATYLSELVARRLCNNIQRSSDAFGAVTHAVDTLTAQVDGNTSTFKTTFFPIVRPYQPRRVNGDVVGAAENPITVTLGGVALTVYDGSNKQAAGTYYRVTNYNLGYIQIVSEAGSPIAPAAATALVLSYDESTNLTKFDLDNGATPIEDHLNGLLRAIGLRRSVLEGERYVNVSKMFALMSPSLNNTITDARQFVESQSKYGTTLSQSGDLASVKGVPAFSTNAPAVDLGSERIIMGEAGTTGYAIVKPYETGQPFEAVGVNGLPLGKKVAYGDELNAIHTPVPVRNRFTSVLAYSATGR